MKLILHIGTHKTGTTAIQSYLDEHRQKLIKNGILYPSCCQQKGEQQFSFFAELIRTKQFEQLADFIEQIKQEAQSCKANTVIVSGEDLSLLTKKQVEQVKQIIDEIGDIDVEIIIYLRNVYDHFISTFAQINRTHSSIELWQDMRKRLVNLMDYDSLLDIWCEVFGDAHVVVQSYDLAKSNLIPHFLMNLPLSKDALTSFQKAGVSRRYQNKNTRFDPFVAVFLILIGYSLDQKDFEKARKLYRARFNNTDFTHDTQLLLTQKFFHAHRLKYKHPKLATIKQELVPELRIDTAKTDREVGEFMIGLGAILTQLGRGKVRDNISGYKPTRLFFERVVKKLKSFWH